MCKMSKMEEINTNHPFQSSNPSLIILNNHLSMLKILIIYKIMTSGDTKEALFICTYCIYYDKIYEKLMGNNDQTVGNSLSVCSITNARFSDLIMALSSDVANLILFVTLIFFIKNLPRYMCYGYKSITTDRTYIEHPRWWSQYPRIGF